MQEIPLEQEQMLHSICQKIYDKKGFNILTLDVRGVSNITDYFIVAEGNVEKHVQALSSAIIDELQSQLKLKPFRTEGERVGDWIVLDYGEVMVHLFISDLREKYALEQVWKEGKIVDVPVKTSIA